MSDSSKFIIATFTRSGWGDGLMALTNNYNQWFNDEDLLEGPQSIGCLVGLTGYSGKIMYYVIYIFVASQSSNSSRILFEKADWSRTWNAPSGSGTWVTYDGVSYLCISNGGWHKKISDGLLYQDSDNYQLMNFEFTSTGGAKLHYLGEYNKTYIDNAILSDAIQYLLTEPAYGQGTVTLSIKKPGQTLNFTSRLLGNTLSQYISSNATIDMDAPINIKTITQLPAQSRTDTHLDGWHGEYVAKYTVNTTNAVLAIMKISTDEYTNLRFYTPYTSTKVHSSEYKLRSTGANISQSSNTPYDIEVRGFEDNRSHAAFTYVTNITLIEVQSAETVLYQTSSSGGVSDQSPLSSGDLSLTSGKYILLAEGNRYADTTHKDCWIENSNGQSLFNGVEYDPYGHSRSIVFGIVNVAGSETFKAYFRVSNSAQGDCTLRAIKLPNDSTVYSENGTGTATSTLSEVCSLSLSVGRYVVVIQTAFDTNSGCKISHQANLGSETIIEENSADTTVYKPVLNSIGYVNVFSAGRVAVSVKATASASVESKIVAVKI